MSSKRSSLRSNSTSEKKNSASPRSRSMTPRFSSMSISTSEGAIEAPPNLLELPIEVLEKTFKDQPLRTRAAVEEVSRYTRGVVRGMPYPFREEYEKLADLFKKLRSTIRVIVDIPAGKSKAAWKALGSGLFRGLPSMPAGSRLSSIVLTAEHDDGVAFDDRKRRNLHIGLMAVVSRPGYPIVFGDIAVEGAMANPQAADALVLFDGYYVQGSPKNISNADGAKGLTAPEAFIEGARIVGSLGLGVVLFNDHHSAEWVGQVSNPVVVPLLEKCGIPKDRIQMTRRVNEGRGNVISGEMVGSVRVEAPLDPYILEELNTEAGIGIDSKRFPADVRFRLARPEGMSYSKWKEEIEAAGPLRYRLVLEAKADAGVGGTRLLLEKTNRSGSSSRARPIEIWFDTDIEDTEYYIRSFVSTVIGWMGRSPNSISIKGEGDMGRGVLAYAVKTATLNQRELFAKNYRG